MHGDYVEALLIFGGVALASILAAIFIVAFVVVVLFDPPPSLFLKILFGLSAFWFVLVALRIVRVYAKARGWL